MTSIPIVEAHGLAKRFGKSTRWPDSTWWPTVAVRAKACRSRPHSASSRHGTPPDGVVEMCRDSVLAGRTSMGS